MASHRYLYIKSYALLIACALLIFGLVGCGKPQPQQAPSPVAQKLYLKSQKALVEGKYEQAYREYQKAVAEDPTAANINHLSSILYSWVLSQSEAADVPLLKAQKRVWLEPKQIALRQGLLSVAVDREKGTIHAFGLTLIRAELPNREQQVRLANDGALADAKAWIARLATWTANGIEQPFDVSGTVTSARSIKVVSIQDVIYIVKVSAPINCLV